MSWHCTVVRAVAPYVSWTSGLLKALVPVVGAAAKLGADAVFTKETNEQLEAMAKVAETIPTAAGEPVAPLVGLHRARPEILALGQVHEAMEAQWPKGARWGGPRRATGAALERKRGFRSIG